MGAGVYPGANSALIVSYLAKSNKVHCLRAIRNMSELSHPILQG